MNRGKLYSPKRHVSKLSSASGEKRRKHGSEDQTDESLSGNETMQEFSQTSWDEILSVEKVKNSRPIFLKASVRQFEDENRGKRSSLKKLVSKPMKAEECSEDQLEENLPENETCESQWLKKTWLQKEFKKATRNSEEVDRLHKLTFLSQQSDISTMELVREVRHQWPFLTELPYMIQYFLWAMEPESPDWNAILERKVPDLLAFLKSKVRSPVVLKCEALQSLLFLCEYFGEENEVVKIFKESDNVMEVVKDDAAIPFTPFIATFGNESNRSMVFIEQEAFTRYIAPEDAFMVWFLSYFVFNLKYPEKCLATLDFVQSGLFGLPENPYGTVSATTEKSMNLMKELSILGSHW